MARGKPKNASSNNAANISFEAKLWLAADKLRSNMDAAEYKHVVLGLIFLNYISDSFEEHHAKLLAAEGEYAGAIYGRDSSATILALLLQHADSRLPLVFVKIESVACDKKFR